MTRASSPPPHAPRVSAWARLKRWAATGGPSPEAPPGRPAPRLADYEPGQVVARTELTTVHRAIERATGRQVALKTVRLGQGSAAERELRRERFLRESEAAARLAHEHIVRVHAGGVQGEGDALTGWLAMEWVAGADLSRYATPARLLPEGVVLEIGSRIALALDFAHRHGVLHRDLKPANVLFDPMTGVVKVIDFGSARVADTAATRSGLLIGTPAYMAPEQLAGAELTPRCDLYALGVLLFELLSGRRPFASDSLGELLSRIARQPAPALRALRPGLPPEVDELVARLLEKSPEARPADGAEVALALNRARTRCAPPLPGSAASRWADTQPVDDPGPDHHDRASAGANQGTIGDSLERTQLRRISPSS